MPFTVSHAAAVMPLRRLCPKYLSLACLIVGSFTPDISYFLPRHPDFIQPHTIAGSFTFCLPAGIALAILFYLLRKPLAGVLPSPHRQALLSLVNAPRPPLITALASILVGAWSHILWDSFTHQGGWFALRLPFLEATAFSYGSHSMPVCRVIQHTSSIVGLIILAAVYLGWLKRHCAAENWSSKLEWSRYLFCVGMIAVPAIVILPMTLPLLDVGSMVTGFRLFIAHSVILYCSVLFSLLVVTGLTLRLSGRD